MERWQRTLALYPEHVPNYSFIEGIGCWDLSNQVGLEGRVGFGIFIFYKIALY